MFVWSRGFYINLNNIEYVRPRTVTDHNTGEPIHDLEVHLVSGKTINIWGNDASNLQVALDVLTNAQEED